MNDITKQAIKDFEAAVMEMKLANNQYGLAKEKTASVIDGCKKDSSGVIRWDHKAIKAASERETSAKSYANFCTAVYWACGQNVLIAAANEVRAAVLEGVKGFSAPIHYKKFEKAFNDLLGDDFYFCNSDYCFYIYFRRAAYGHNSIWVGSKENGCVVVNEKEEKRIPLSLDEIRYEANKAIKDADEIRKAVEALKSKDSAVRGSYKSYIRYLVPSVEVSVLRDSYRLF